MRSTKTPLGRCRYFSSSSLKSLTTVPQEAMALIVEVETVTSSVVTHSFSPKSTADPKAMLLLLSTAIASILEKLDDLYSATQLSFLPSTDPSAAFPFEWRTCFNITSGSSVSIFTPLARFLARLLQSASAWSLPFSLTSFVPLSIVQMRGISIACDYAIRNLSFASQVETELWRRNGLSAVNLIFNYSRSALSKYFRDPDLTVIQLGVVWIGPDLILSNLLRAFECSLLESERVRKLKYSTRALMLRELLRWLILIVTYLPHDLSSLRQGNGNSSGSGSGETGTGVGEGESKMDLPPQSAGEGLELTVDRLVAHLLLCGKTSKGKLQTVKGFMRLDTRIGDDEINGSVDRLCQRKPQQSQLDSEPATLNPEPVSVLQLFDPEHPYLQTKELQLANEKARAHRSKPEIAQALFATVAEATAAVTGGDMKRPSLPPQRSTSTALHLPLPVVFATALPTPHPEFLVVRQLLSSNSFVDLMITALALPSNSDIVNLSVAKDESKIPRSTTLAIVSRCVHLLTIHLHSSRDLSAEWNHLPSQWTTDLLPLLTALHRSGLLTEDPLYSQGLDWLLREYCWRCDAAQKALVALGYEGALEIEAQRNNSQRLESSVLASETAADASATAESAMEKRKLEARRRAMAAMKKNATAFSAQLAGEDDEEEQELGKEREPVPDCIICREKTSNPVGYFMHIQPSRVIHRAISQGPEGMAASKLHLVLRRTATFAAPVIESSVTTPRPLLKFSLEPGDVIEIAERTLVSWVRFCSPRGEGWAEMFQTTTSASGAGVRVHLIPLDILTHSRHGAVRPYGETN
jgi:hypothetical protein